MVRAGDASERRASQLRGARAAVGRAHLRHGYRQRDARLVLRRRHRGPTEAASRARSNAMERGADILDVGGESTRPGHRPIDECARRSRACVPVDSRDARRSCPRADFDRYVQAGGRCARRTPPAPISSTRCGERRTSSWTSSPNSRFRSSRCTIRSARSTTASVVDAVLRYLEDCAARARRARNRAASASFSIRGSASGRRPIRTSSVLAGARPHRRARLSDDDRYVAQIDDRQADRDGRAATASTEPPPRRARRRRRASTSCACTTSRRHATRSAVADAIVRGWRPARGPDNAERDPRVRPSRCRSPDERERRQPFEIDVTAEIDLRCGRASDDLSQTIDYAALRKRARSRRRRRRRTRCSNVSPADLLDAVFDDRARRAR